MGRGSFVRVFAVHTLCECEQVCSAPAQRQKRKQRLGRARAKDTGLACRRPPRAVANGELVECWGRLGITLAMLLCHTWAKHDASAAALGHHPTVSP